ncbi:MAG: hypothetical protein BJ554DRAFT_3522 [Olpidium bornovanus]|uniref:Uncharacterized protein n=1 Tax=Olpidium bornovanus TaxID=278681 RepID=A0A8H7ZNN0_9FUNG|nr:MAG: hypothetical protein BJ554DRAFT_3522 [Olpidium bornovanus]
MIVSPMSHGPRAKVVSGRDLLDNNQVNMISSLTTSCLTALIGTYCLRP